MIQPACVTQNTLDRYVVYKLQILINPWNIEALVVASFRLFPSRGNGCNINTFILINTDSQVFRSVSSALDHVSLWRGVGGVCVWCKVTRGVCTSRYTQH